MPKLVARSGPTAGQEYILNQDVTVMGRQSVNDIQIQDSNASRQHCEIRHIGAFWVVADLDSRNGIQLNGRRVRERTLDPGDTIRVGEVEYVFVALPGEPTLETLLTKYAMERRIGEGGMGMVYKATQRSMQRIVALKVLAPRFAAKERHVEQFIKEARAAGALNHPNIVQVHDVGTENGVHYFSMEYVEGQTAAQLLKERGRLSPGEALEIVRQTALALEYAHAHHLLHQDVKPDNLMVSPGPVVKLADLGISRTFEEAAEQQANRRVMGTPHYMAPEAASGKPVDQRSDLYSLGVTLYQLLSGAMPFDGGTPAEILKSVVNDPLPSLRGPCPELPQGVIDLTNALLAKDPAMRPATAALVVADITRLQTSRDLSVDSTAAALKRWADGSPRPTVAGRQDTPARHTTGNQQVATPSPKAGGPLRMLVAVAALVAVAGAGAWYLIQQSAAEPAAGAPPVTAEATTSEPVAEPAQPSSPVSDPALEQAKAHAAQLSELERQLALPSAQLDLIKAKSALAAIPESLDGPLSVRRQAAAARLELIESRQQQARLATDLSTLSSEVERLVTSKDHDLALKRIEAFPSKQDAIVAEAWQRLRDDTLADKDRYGRWLADRVKIAAARKDAPALQELKAALPPAWRASAPAKEIDEALTRILQEQAASQNLALAKVGKAVARWNLAETDSAAAQVTGEAKATAEAWKRAARALATLPPAIAARLAKDGNIRFSGSLAGQTNPDLKGATSDHLEMKEAHGGVVFANWPKLTPAEIEALVSQLLPGELEQWKPTFAALGQAQAASGGK